LRRSFHRASNHKPEKEMFCICEWIVDRASKNEPQSSPEEKEENEDFQTKTPEILPREFQKRSSYTALEGLLSRFWRKKKQQHYSPGKLRLAVQNFRKRPAALSFCPVPNGHQALARTRQQTQTSISASRSVQRCTVRVTLGGHARPADTIRGLNNKPLAPARAPGGVSEVWFLEMRSFTGGTDGGMENEDVENRWEQAFKYEGIRVSG
jgi:hypothetical protein